MPVQHILAPADLGQLKTQAKELRDAYCAGAAAAHRRFDEFHPNPPPPRSARLSDAQLVMARERDFPSWPRLNVGVALFNAIHADNADVVEELLRNTPALWDWPVNGETSSWGKPLACAAQLGAATVLERLLTLQPDDLQHALDRAILKGRADLARRLVRAGAELEPGLAMGPCETLNIAGLNFLADLGAPLTDADGDPRAPVAMILQGYHRDPAGKHACLALFKTRGMNFPDTPVMALHCGDILRLEAFLAADPQLVNRRFGYHDIYPLSLGCSPDHSLGLHGTPLDGAGLLHMAMDFDEMQIAQLLLARGADPNLRALRGKDGYGGHAPLFNAVVSQATLSSRRDDALVRLLLDAGADPHQRATLCKAIRFHEDESAHVYRDVTALEYAQQFHAPAWVNQAGVELLRQRVGRTG